MTDNKAKKRTIMDEEERKFYENLGSRLRNYINHYNISLEYVKKIMKVRMWLYAKYYEKNIFKKRHR